MQKIDDRKKLEMKTDEQEKVGKCLGESKRQFCEYTLFTVLYQRDHQSSCNHHRRRNENREFVDYLCHC